MTGTYILGIIALFFAAFIFIGIRNNINEKKLFMKKCADEYGAAPSSRLKKQRDDISGFYNANKGDFFIDDITWNDLDMDDVLLRINHTGSFIGEQVLYNRLHCLKETDKRSEHRASGNSDSQAASGKDQWEDFEKMADYFTLNQVQRSKVWEKLRGIGKKNTAYYMTELMSYFEPYSRCHMLIFRMLQITLVASFIGFVITA